MFPHPLPHCRPNTYSPSPCSSVMFSELRLRSLFSVSRALCRLRLSCSRPSRLLSSWTSLSCSSLSKSSSCCACLAASAWAFFTRPDSSTSACSLALTSSSYRGREKRKKKWRREGRWAENACSSPSILSDTIMYQIVSCKSISLFVKYI